MATVTPNFNWPVPTSTDLVKDGATAIEALGDSIDASLVDLKGGTTGQVLSKTSGTDMDFTWVTSDDANAIQNTIVDAKGDLISASAADTPARLAVGSNGETLVADSSTSTGLRYTGNYAAGKNAIINGAFNVNQRSFTSTTTSGTYGFDRFFMFNSDGTCTYSAQTFTAGTAPVAGYEATNFARLVTTGQTLSSAFSFVAQRIEDVRTFANQTVTVSFWAKAATGTPKIAIELDQTFGSGGSTRVLTAVGQPTISTSWARYSATIAVPSISGKTIGSGSYLSANLIVSAGADYNSRSGSLGIQSNTFDIWGVQVEAGSVATAFQTATGTIQGELAACQRYYWRAANSTNYSVTLALGRSSTIADVQLALPVTMRIAPTAIEYSGTTDLTDPNVAGYNATSLTFSNASNSFVKLQVNTASGLSQGKVYIWGTQGTAYFAFSGEL